MVKGKDRCPELGSRLAIEFCNNFSYPAKQKNSKFNEANINLDGTLVKIKVTHSNKISQMKD